MALMTRDQVLARIAAGNFQRWVATKIGGVTPEAAGAWATTYTDVGSPGAAANPTTWANCTGLAGTVNFTNVSPSKRYLWSVDALATADCTLMIYDRLGHIGNISLASTGNKTISSSALPRSMDAVDLNNIEAWLELTTQTSTTAPVLSMNSYTNQNGDTLRAGGSVTFPSTVTNVGWMTPLPVQAGDKAVQACSTINVSIAAAAGVANFLFLRPLAFIPCKANIVTPIELPQLPRVYDGSSICFALLATAAAAVNLRTVNMTCVYD